MKPEEYGSIKDTPLKQFLKNYGDPLYNMNAVTAYITGDPYVVSHRNSLSVAILKMAPTGITGMEKEMTIDEWFRYRESIGK